MDKRIIMKILFILATIFLAILVFADPVNADSFGYDSSTGFGFGGVKETITTGGNYTINVNNTDHFGGYTTTGFKDWIQGLFDSVYCLLTGCTMSGNIDMGNNNLTNVNRINELIICNNGTGTILTRNATLASSMGC